MFDHRQKTSIDFFKPSIIKTIKVYTNKRFKNEVLQEGNLAFAREYPNLLKKVGKS